MKAEQRRTGEKVILHVIGLLGKIATHRGPNRFVREITAHNSDKIIKEAREKVRKALSQCMDYTAELLAA